MARDKFARPPRRYKNRPRIAVIRKEREDSLEIARSVVCSEEERPGVLPGPDWQTKTKRIGQRLSRILMRSGTVQYQSHRERVVFCLRTICLQVENGKSGGFVDPAFR